MVSACFDASLRLRWCHSGTRTSQSPELLPWQGKLCKELPIFFFFLFAVQLHIRLHSKDRGNRTRQQMPVMTYPGLPVNQRDAQIGSITETQL